MSSPPVSDSKDEGRPRFPAHVGRYRVTGMLGKGAMGTVYRAEDPLIERDVAIKVLSLDLSPEARATFREHFFSEGKSAGGLNHPNIVTVYDIGESQGVPYIAMEFVEGLSLRESLDLGTVMPVRRVVDIGLAMCRGLDFAHSRGVIHRDIKPANVMLSRNGLVKIMDFGIASSRASLSPEQTLPRGHVLGSPKYMAPEQLMGGVADVRSDLFSLAVTLYELLVGRNPFEADSIGEVVDKVLKLEAPTARELNPDVPRELDLLLLRAMQKDPARRFESAGEMGRVLRNLRRELRATATSGSTRRAPSAGGHGATVVVTAAAEAPRKGAGADRRVVIGAAVAVALAAAAVVLLVFGGGVVAPDAGPMPAVAETAQPAAAAVTSEELLADVDIFAPPVLQLPIIDEVAPQILPEQVPPAVAAADHRAPAAAARPAPTTGDSTLRLSVLPWGEVFVNGRAVGYSPPLTRLQLPAGHHRIEIRNLDFAPFVADVRLKSGGVKSLRHRFDQ
ncbi:MAG: serine/threonine protein kinase [Rhodocyclaceae bacterium]|nr:serine/threonine protein kinase [Rhodocyclaceae bacterium]